MFMAAPDSTAPELRLFNLALDLAATRARLEDDTLSDYAEKLVREALLIASGANSSGQGMEPGAIRLALATVRDPSLQAELRKISRFRDLTPESAIRIKQGVEAQLAA